MKVYRVEVMVLDFDRLGADGIRTTLENTRYPNRCIAPEVVKIQEADIGEWDDSHPLNSTVKWKAEFQRLFPY